ncbi:MAG TPA: hypothetical protein VJR05_11125, partial [Acidimicrobiia bacterium]|nr:hypothetical protein [Acidimicrobiia bacterium]
MRLVPIACSLDAGETRSRAEEWAGLAGLVLGVEQSDQMLTIRFSATAEDELMRLVEAEGQCCSFARWDLAEAGEEVILTVT